ncbi:macrolide 2'-phosphotransferase [Evansella halocellulosilytica]|uniref:macrolide 2'-phosphotransferase n=1 Tax=Evansella halocellulosilytica TaxID=2011013 RepID=UPI000BB80894|nr:macrolide 2'-phosphotransferase [Evansella halocellulosilytica]
MKQTKGQVIELAQKHGLMLKEDSLSFNESGVDFLVVLAADKSGEKWVLRIPRREDVIPSTVEEKRALEFIEPRISVQAPKWTVYSDELIAYKQLTGVPAGTADKDAKAYVWEIDEKNLPDQFTETLAKAMVSLHRVDSQEAKRAGLSVESAEEARESMKKRMEKVKSEFGVSPELWERWQSWLANDALWPKNVGLTHGDLHAGHILIDENDRVTGFIDWTEASVTDISIDFVSHYMVFGEEALEELIMHYEKAGGYVWPQMKKHIIERTASYAVPIAELAMKSGLEEYHEMAKQVLGVNES